MPSWKRRGSGEPITSKPNAGAAASACGSRSARMAIDSMPVLVPVPDDAATAASLPAASACAEPALVKGEAVTEAEPDAAAAVDAADAASHCAASKPVFAPQYGAARLLAKIRTSSPVWRAKSACAYCSATSHTRSAACGTSNTSRRLSAMVRGSAYGSRSEITRVVQRLNFAAMLSFS
jgi:hypothetical protein